MAASREYLISVSTRIERSCELDTFQGLFSHNHSLQLYFAHNDGPSIQKDLDPSCVLGLCGIEINSCSIAQSDLMACDVDIVFNADLSFSERT